MRASRHASTVALTIASLNSTFAVQWMHGLVSRFMGNI